MTSAQFLWTLRSHWHTGSLRAWAAVAALVLSTLACVLAGLWYRNAQRQEAIAQEQLSRTNRAALPIAVAPASTANDFTATLGLAPPPERLVNVIQGAAARAGVTMASVHVQERPAAPDRLGRTEVPIVLQGMYPAIKRCLAEILDRIPHATVARLQWQRMEGAADTEVRVQLVVWSAPVPAGAASAARP